MTSVFDDLCEQLPEMERAEVARMLHEFVEALSMGSGAMRQTRTAAEAPTVIELHARTRSREARHA